jgi:hypothetical protein
MHAEVDLFVAAPLFHGGLLHDFPWHRCAAVARAETIACRNEACRENAYARQDTSMQKCMKT